MTDTPKTVEVPVELLNRAAVALAGTPDDGARADLLALIPKPKPRLVAVDVDKWRTGKITFSSFDAQPDLLDTLDSVIDKWWQDYTSDDSDDLKAAVRTALGVDHD